MPVLTITLRRRSDNSLIAGQQFVWSLLNVNSPVQVDQGATNSTNLGKVVIDLGDTPQARLNYESERKFTLKWTCQGERGEISPLVFVRLPFIRSDQPTTATKTVSIGYECDSMTPNASRHWLTYETRLNWAPYCKTNKQFDMKLYRTDAHKMLLIVAPLCDLDAPTLATLGAVFFPGIPPEDLREYGKAPWTGRRRFFEAPSQLQQAGNRDQQNIRLPTYAVLPYNARDNTAGSQAIGTMTTSRVQKLRLTPLQAVLPMWNTASRSSLARFNVPVQVDQITPVGQDQLLLWPDNGNPDPLRFLDAANARPIFDFTAEPLAQIFSVKSGVDLIGFEAQPKKAKLEHNSILAALRCAYIRLVEADFYPQAIQDGNMLILTELMTVTEADPYWDLWIEWRMGADNPCDWNNVVVNSRILQPQFGDGFQIRSLRGMRADRGYFPPTSIPFVSVLNGAIDANSRGRLTHNRNISGIADPMREGMPKSLEMFTGVADPNWKSFWKRHYAVALGRTKARLLLRYGLQGFGGNAQNFLIEMDNGIPNGRIVVRDMGDYALHDFFLWAIFGPGAGAAPDPRRQGPGQQEAFVTQWRDAFKLSPRSAGPLLWFECKVLHDFHHDYAYPVNAPRDVQAEVAAEINDRSEFPTFTGYHRWASSEMHTLNAFCPCCDQTKTAAFVGHISPLWAYALPVSPQKMDNYNCDVNMARWGQIFEAELEWGIAHAMAWIQYLEAALGPAFTNAVVHKIDWTPVPAVNLVQSGREWRQSNAAGIGTRIHRPADYRDPAYLGVDLAGPAGDLLIQDPGSAALRNKWSELYEHMKTWEMYLGMQVENFLGTVAGQDAIRAYVNGGWNATEQRVANLPWQAVFSPFKGLRITIIGRNSGQPVAHMAYTLTRGDATFQRHLDNEGVDRIDEAFIFEEGDETRLTFVIGSELYPAVLRLNRAALPEPTRSGGLSYDLDYSYVT